MRRSTPSIRRPSAGSDRSAGGRSAGAAAFLGLASALGLALALIWAAAGPASANEAPVPGTAAWSLLHEEGEGHCLAHAFFPRSRIALGFVSDGRSIGVALVHPAWRLREWQGYEVAFRFDGGRVIRARLTATGASAMAIELDAETERGFREAAAVQILAAGVPAAGRLSLAGSARAIDYVRACGEIAATTAATDGASIRD